MGVLSTNEANTHCRKNAVPNQTTFRNTAKTNDFGGQLRFKPDSRGSGAGMTNGEAAIARADAPDAVCRFTESPELHAISTP
jgi:hypothetical protein